MASELPLALAGFVLLAVGIWYYTKHVEPDGPRSDLKQRTIVAVAITIVLIGRDLIAFMPLRAVVAIALAFLAGHLVESVDKRGSLG